MGKLLSRRLWKCLYFRRRNRLFFATATCLVFVLVVTYFQQLQTDDTLVALRNEFPREDTQRRTTEPQGGRELPAKETQGRDAEKLQQPKQGEEKDHAEFNQQRQELKKDPLPLKQPPVAPPSKDELLKMCRVDMNYTLPPGQSPWQLAESWVTSTQLLPDHAPGLGAVLREMAMARITWMDDGGRGKGNQLKLFLLLQGDQWAVFKPKRYARDFVWKGKLCDVNDMHNAEIAAFHLSRVLGFRKTPLAVGRVLSLSKEVKPVATENLLETFYYDTATNETCFYGHCANCATEPGHKAASVCSSDDRLEGAVILWLPDSAALHDDRYHDTHPWGRICFERDYVTRLVQNQTYCSAVQTSKFQPSSLLDKIPYPNPFYKNSAMFLDLVDSAILHYLITNADRKVNWVNHGIYRDLFVMLDNGKSFQDPERDEELVLAPLSQCCRVRRTTYDRLLVLSGGVLSSVLRDVLTSDPLSPLLTDLHLSAIDRRLVHVMETVERCVKTHGASFVFGL